MADTNVSIVSKPDRGLILTKDGRASAEFQQYLDDITQLLNDNLLGLQVQLTSYTVSTLPVATTDGGLIFVTDETGGAVPAFSDGTNWRRTTDRTVVS